MQLANTPARTEYGIERSDVEGLPGQGVRRLLLQAVDRRAKQHDLGRPPRQQRPDPRALLVGPLLYGQNRQRIEGGSLRRRPARVCQRPASERPSQRFEGAEPGEQEAGYDARHNLLREEKNAACASQLVPCRHAGLGV